MTDRELLEAAAKAAGISIDKSAANGGGVDNTGFDMAGNAVLDWHNGKTWNPLSDDGDALRLAVKLKVPLQFPDWQHIAKTWGPKNEGQGYIETALDHNGDLAAAVRRALVRAAAALGRSYEGEGK